MRLPDPRRVLSAAKPGSPDSMLSIYLPAFILAAGVSIAAPALPLYAKSFQVNFATASLVVVVNQLGAALSTLPNGYLIDRLGGRKMVLAGPILTAATSLLMATAHSFPELLAYRFLEGWAMQMWTLGRLELITARGGAHRGSQITGMFGMDAAGRLTGPAIGGFVAGAWGLRAPFVLYGIVALLSVVPSFVLVREHNAQGRRAVQAAVAEAPKPALRESLKALLTFPILLLFVSQFLSFMTRGALFGGTLDLYAVYAYGIGPQTLGFLALGAGLLGLPLTFTSGRLMDRLGRRTIIVPGFCLLGLALMTMATASFGHWPFSEYVGVFLFARLATSSISGSMQVIGSDMAPPQARGTFFGVFSLIRQTGSFLSPAVFAFMSQTWSFGSAFVLLSVMAFATALMTNTQLKRAPAVSAPVAEVAVSGTGA